MNIEHGDLEDVPYNTIGGRGKAYDFFGDKLIAILDALKLR